MIFEIHKMDLFVKLFAKMAALQARMGGGGGGGSSSASSSTPASFPFLFWLKYSNVFILD